MTSPAASKNAPLRTVRRGLLAAAWAAVASVVLRRTAERVEAGTDGDVVLGAANFSTTTTGIHRTTIGTALEVSGQGAPAFAVRGDCEFIGVAGTQSTSPLQGPPGGAGVWGHGRPDGNGVAGMNSGRGVGVLGSCDEGTGVLGKSRQGFPIVGQTSGVGLCPVAVYGINVNFGFGVYGLSTSKAGVAGATTAQGSAGVVGTASGISGAYAAVFYGPVVVQGDFAVVGAKSAAVPHPDGSHRQLYCVESPESWFEDFGKGQLKDGCAEVPTDPIFAAMSMMDDYHVFLTGYEDFELRVRSQTPTGFCVESKDPSSNGRFSWRIVAKRRDLAGPRFNKVTVPPEPPPPPPPPNSDAPLHPGSHT